MNELLSLLLLSTAARRNMKKTSVHHTHAPMRTVPVNSPNANSMPQPSTTRTVTYKPLRQEMMQQAPMQNMQQNMQQNTQQNSQEITTPKLLDALYAADEAVNMKPYATGPFTLPQLNYDYDALEPYIDEKTLRIHHLGHHNTYVNNLNTALSRYPDYYGATLNELLLFPDRLPGDIQRQVTNNAGGHYNHELMWQVIGPPRNSRPTGALGAAINAQFGSFDNFKDTMSQAAESVFGSGFAYLALNPYGRLIIITTPNQNTPIPLRLIPLLPLDVWEHAYYLKHQNNRKQYINDYFNVINWDKVGKRYDAAMAALNTPSM